MGIGIEGYKGLELSTQLVIAEAKARGHVVELLDPAMNFIRIRGRGKVELIRQATRTSADSYIVPLAMENKKVTKILLAEAGIRTPEGKDYGSLREALGDAGSWRGKALVVKPNMTNFGVGVSVFPEPPSEGAFEEALELAFGAASPEDGKVLVEEYAGGKEYRFLVIGGMTRAVLHRLPANVTGDGASSVAELVEEKNRDPRRGEGYEKPLERIRLGATELGFLGRAGLGPGSRPAAGERVILRENSNISTGGDSVDFTDSMPAAYKDLAAAAAESVGARICGVDMMVEDLGREPGAGGYSVIELNFNPALHIHDFPYEGRDRKVERHVLDLVGL